MWNFSSLRGVLGGTGRIFFFLAVSLLLHGVWFWLSPQGSGPQPVSAPLEIGLRQLPREAVSTPPAPAPSARPASVLPAVQPTPLPRQQAKSAPSPPSESVRAPSSPAQPASKPNAPEREASTGAAIAESREPAEVSSSASAAPATGNLAAVAQEAAAQVEAVPLAGENPPPIYPRLARQRGWEGLVALRVKVSAAGEVVEAWVENSSGHGVLDQAALTAVKSWRFRPAQEGMRAVAGVARVPIEFRLRGG